MTSRHLIIIISFIIVSCSSNSEDQNRVLFNDQIITLQKKSQTQKDSTLFYLKEADKLILKYSQSINDSLKIENNYLKGLHYFNNEQLDSSSIYFYKTIEQIEDTLKYDRQIFYFHHAWNSHRLKNQYGDCIAIIQKMESLLDEKNYRDRASVNYYFKRTYERAKEYPKALLYSDAQIDMLKKNNDTITLIGAIISKTNLQYHHLNDVDAAFKTLEELLENQQELNTNFKRQLFIQYGYYNHLERNYKIAEEYYLKGLETILLLKEGVLKREELINIYSNLGEVNIDLKNYTKANYYLEKAIKFLKDNTAEHKIRNLLSYKLRYAFETGSDVLSVQKHLDTILEYQNTKYKDKYEDELKSLKTLYQKEKELQDKNQITELENLKLRTRQIIIFLSSLLLLSLGYVLYRRRQHSFQKESLQMQQRLLRSQMNPHFTFNTLYAIQNTIKTNQQGAIDYLLKFSRLLRLILENSVHNYIPLELELESLRKYMDLQLLRFSDKFDYVIEINNSQNENEEEDELHIPPMLLQPFIENSIEHGFKGIAYKGIITITLKKELKYINCRIEDNGIGISAKRTKRVSSTQLISHFIEKTTKRKIKTINKNDVDSNQTGVIIEFLIPYKYVADD